MPVAVRCPKCGKELMAPEGLIGKVAACPQCNASFPLTESVRGSTATQSATPTSTWTGPPVAPAGTGSSWSGAPIAAASVPSNLPPTVSVSGRAIPPPPPPSDARNSSSVASPAASSPPVPVASPEPRQPKTVPSSTATTPAVPVTPTESKRVAQPARFVAANPTEQRINLGADGRLPELRLQEGAKSEAVGGTPRTSNPLVLIGVLSVSFGLSALLLLMDTETKRSESELEAQAREEMAQHYTRSYRRVEPYQEELRRALQFHNQGKYAEERRCYRRVLDLLHEEHRDNLKGLTGVRHGAAPPSDEHLESLLSQLLSEN